MFDIFKGEISYYLSEDITNSYLCFFFKFSSIYIVSGSSQFLFSSCLLCLLTVFLAINLPQKSSDIGWSNIQEKVIKHYVNLCTWVRLAAGLVCFWGNPLSCALAPWGVGLQ